MSPGVAFALVVSMVAVASCGGSSGSSKSDFVAKADRACRQSNKTRPTKSPRNASEAALQTKREVVARVGLDRQLRRLAVPKGLKDDVARYNAQTERAIDLIRDQHRDAVAEREAAYGTHTKRLDELLKQRDRTAARIGFKECGRAIKKPH
jgi:hypothetical protein